MQPPPPTTALCTATALCVLLLTWPDGARAQESADPAAMPGLRLPTLVERETLREFLDSLAEGVIAPDPYRYYRKDGSRREVGLARGVTLSLEEKPPTRLGSNVSLPGAAGAPGRLWSLEAQRRGWWAGSSYQRLGTLGDRHAGVAVPLAEGFSLRGGWRQQDSDSLAERRRDAELGLAFDTLNWHADFGLHHAQLVPTGVPITPAPQAEGSATLLRARGAWQPEAVPGLTLLAEAEQVLRADPALRDQNDPLTRDRFELGANYKLGDAVPWQGATVYWREAPRLGLLSHGEALDLRSAYRRTIGIEGSDGTPEGTLYLQWREHSLSDANDALVIAGWRHGFRLAPRWYLGTRVEQATPMAGSTALRSTTLGSSLSYGTPQQSFAIDLEGVNADTRNSAYGAMKLTQRLDEALVTAWRLQLSRAQPHGQALLRTTEYKLSSTWGWREPEQRRWNALARYTYTGRDSNEPLYTNRRAHIVATHLGHEGSNGDKWMLRGTRRWDHDTAFAPDPRRITTIGLVRGVWALGGRWSASAHLAQRRDSFDGTQPGYGAEIGLRASRQVVVALGYNPRGFSDHELRLDERPERGVTLRLRFSVGTALGRWLDPVP